MPCVCITEKVHAYVISHTLCINLCVFIREVVSSTLGQDTDYKEPNCFRGFSGLLKGCWNNGLNYFKPTTLDRGGTVVKVLCYKSKFALSITAGVIGNFH